MGDERSERKRGFVIVTAAMLGLAAPACDNTPPPASAPYPATSSGGSVAYAASPSTGVYVQQGPAVRVAPAPIVQTGVAVGAAVVETALRTGAQIVYGTPRPGTVTVGVGVNRMGQTVQQPGYYAPQYSAPVGRMGGGGSRMK